MSISYYLDSDDVHSSSTAWVLDTGASSYITFNIQELASSSSLQSRDVRLRISNGSTIEILAIGSKSLYMYGHILYLNNILYVPNAFKNIISVSSLTRNCYEF